MKKGFHFVNTKKKILTFNLYPISSFSSENGKTRTKKKSSSAIPNFLLNA